MSPLDDARKLARPDIGMHCDFCTGSPESGHFDGCPMLALPRIVAVLEAAERVLDRRLPPSKQIISLPDDVRLVSTEALYALYAALKGE
jgi:hypothetical protein